MIATATASASPNAILAGLDPKESGALQAASQEISLQRGELIAEAGQPAPYVYFPMQGVLSLVGTTTEGSTVEVACVGNEGVASLSSVLGTNLMPFRIMTQVPGLAVRVPAEVVSDLIVNCGDLHRRLLTYTNQLIAQVVQSAVCNRFHNAKQRLARWLLMTADRADSRDLPLTHEFISYMVGGPRSAVTEAASELRESGAIDYRRGLITIRSDSKLREQSCECYEVLLETNGGRQRQDPLGSGGLGTGGLSA
jgi:CRP-like cAMP-binding protein